MTTQTTRHSPAWLFFTYASFACSIGMTLGGVLFMPLDYWMKGFLIMAVVLIVQSCITLTKTLRDNEEDAKLLNRIEDARTERLLKEAASA